MKNIYKILDYLLLFSIPFIFYMSVKTIFFLVLVGGSFIVMKESTYPLFDVIIPSGIGLRACIVAGIIVLIISKIDTLAANKN